MMLPKGMQFLLHKWHPSCYSYYKPVHEPLSVLSTVETRCVEVEDLLFLLELSEYSRHVKYCLQ